MTREAAGQSPDNAFGALGSWIQSNDEIIKSSGIHGSDRRSRGAGALAVLDCLLLLFFPAPDQCLIRAMSPS